MSFDVAAGAYDRFMGRYSTLLAPRFADFAGIDRDRSALDVGCGPGALTTVLVQRLGAANVVAVDPSVPFVEAARTRLPGVEVHQATAEHLPFDDERFDAALAQLVVHFMSDPVAGLTEMKRVTGTDGIVAACVWDFGGGRAPLSTFWEAAHELDATVVDESRLAGAREGHLGDLFEQAGLREIETTALAISLEHQTFDDWWEPFTQGVGPAGSYVAGLVPTARAELRDRCRGLLPEPPFVLTSRAWAARGRA
jgi:SAM-dependent methyltransferase